MASIDGCIRLLEARREFLTGWSTNLKNFDQSVNNFEKLKIIGHGLEVDACGFDPSKLPIYTGCSSLSGYQLADILRNEFAIEPEYASPKITLCMTGCGDTADSLTRLAGALTAIDRRIDHRIPDRTQPVTKLLAHTEMVIHPEKALESPSELLALKNAAGRICGEYVWAYPPGIPLLIPGERIPPELYEMTVQGKSPELHSTCGKIPSYIRALS